MSARYYLLLDDQKYGPYTRDELLDAGMERDTLVWFAGQPGWVPAGHLAELDGLLREAERDRRQRRRVESKAALLPEPSVLRHLSRASLAVHVPAAGLFLIGTTALGVAIVLWFVQNSGGAPGRPPPPPGPGLVLTTRVAGWLGLVTTGLSAPLLIVELCTLAAFVWQCRKIVRAIAPKAGSLKWSEISEEDNFILTLTIIFLIVFLGICLFVFTFVFAILYVWLALSIYRLGYGLNAAKDRYRLENVPWAPVTLAFWTAMSGFLLMAGPFSLAAFILLPIWLHRTAETAIGISEDYRGAVEREFARAGGVALEKPLEPAIGTDADMRGLRRSQTFS